MAKVQFKILGSLDFKCETLALRDGKWTCTDDECPNSPGRKCCFDCEMQAGCMGSGKLCSPLMEMLLEMKIDEVWHTPTELLGGEMTNPEGWEA